MRPVALNFLTRSQLGRYWQLYDIVKSESEIKTNENGFASATIKLNRDFAAAWDDIGLNYQIYAYTPVGKVAWHGRIDTIELALDRGKPTMTVTALGLWASAFDTTFNGSLVSGTPESLIAQFLNSTYLPQLKTASSGLVATGLTSQSYSSPNSGSDDQRPGEAISTICSWGDSAGNRVIPAVWEDRTLITYKVTATPSARYIIRRANVAAIGLRRSLSGLATNVLARYRSTTDGKIARYTTPDSYNLGSALGIDYDGTGTTTAFKRVRVMDITGLDPIAAATAQNMATTKLNQVAQIRNDSQSITIEKEYVVIDTVLGEEIPNCLVRAGNWVMIPDLYPRNFTGAGTGESASGISLVNMFYIVETNYKDGTLTLTPEGNALDA